MQWIIELFKALLSIGNIWMVLLLCYHFYLTFYGFKRNTRSYATQLPATRFLILVPAHNEETVVADMVESLRRIDYPKELVDFYIIADNCTDSTAQIVRNMGANVIETHKEFDGAPTGKPIALKKALNFIEGYEKKYDLLMIFDADNLMDTNILAEVNSQYISEGKPEVIQCYLGSKNKNGLVAAFYHATYTITNRFFQFAKYRLHTNASIGGTGFAISTQYLYDRGGWTTQSLTEDFEMHIDVSLHGGRILWNHNTHIYDEKPTHLYASFRQRTRWSQGHWFVALRNTPRLFSQFIRGKLSVREFISLFCYMYSMVAPIQLGLLLLSLVLKQMAPLFYGHTLAAAAAAAQTAVSIGMSAMLLPQRVIVASLSVALLIYSFFVLFYVADVLDNHTPVQLSRFPLLLVSYFVNLINVSLAQIFGFCMRHHQNNWVKTKHSIQKASPTAISTSQNGQSPS